MGAGRARGFRWGVSGRGGGLFVSWRRARRGASSCRPRGRIGQGAAASLRRGAGTVLFAGCSWCSIAGMKLDRADASLLWRVGAFSLDGVGRGAVGCRWNFRGTQRRLFFGIRQLQRKPGHPPVPGLLHVRLVVLAFLPLGMVVSAVAGLRRERYPGRCRHPAFDTFCCALPLPATL